MTINQFPLWSQTDSNGQVSEYTSDYFAYVIGPAANGAIGSLAAATASMQNLNFQADSYFVLNKISYTAILDGVTDPQPDNVMCPVTVFISDAGSGKQLMFAPVPLSTIAGPGREPFIVPGTRIFLPTSTVTFAFFNPDTTAWNNIALVLHGRKIYDVTSR